jgi:hypothetical protein
MLKGMPRIFPKPFPPEFTFGAAALADAVVVTEATAFLEVSA